jgi:hypothetical protein
MLPNPAPVVSNTDALYVQMPGAGMGVSSSSPLLMSSGSDILAPVQQQMMLPANQAYLLQLQLQQQQHLQQQAKLQALQMELQQQQNNVRAALHGMEQQQRVSTPQSLAAAAAAAGSSSFEGYPLTAFSSASAGFPATTVNGQPGSSSAAMPAADASADFVCLQNGLANSMANMSIGGGINFASGQCIVGIDNSGNNALAVSESMLAAAGQQQQQQRNSGLVESWL